MILRHKPYVLITILHCFFTPLLLAQSTTIDSLLELGWELAATQKEKAILLTEDALDKAEQASYQTGKGNALNQLGVIYKNKGEYPIALQYFEKSKAVRISIKDSLGVAGIDANMGDLERRRGNYELAYKYLIRAVEFYEKTDSINRLAKCYQNIANVFEDQETYSSAEEYYLKALVIFKATNDSLSMADATYNLAIVAYYKDDLKQASQLAREAKVRYAELNNWEGEAALINLLANIYWEKEDYENAAAYFQEGIQLHEENQDQSISLFDLHLNYGNLLNELNQTKEAIIQFKKAKTILANNGGLEDHLLLIGNLADLFEKSEQFDSALIYRNEQIGLNDSLYQIEKTGTLAEMQIRFETEQKKKELAEEKLINQQKTTRLYWLTGLLMTALVFATLIYLFFRQRQRNQKTITAQKELIHQQKVEELLQREELTTLNAMLEGQDNERQRIAKDLHDRLGSMLTAIKWRFEGFLSSNQSEEQGKDLAKTHHMMEDAYQEVRRVAHDLSTGVLTKFGLIAALEALKNSISISGEMKVELVIHGLENRLDQSTEIIIYRLVQELISNILKHAKATTISIELSQLEDRLHLTVEDDGQGFDIRQQKTGMGLKNIEARLQHLNGHLHIDAQPQRGVIVMIEIPL